MKVHYRKTWRNDFGNQVAEPLRLYVPESLDDLIQIVTDAEANGLTVRAVGGHHAWSDVAISNDYMVDTRELRRVLDLEADLLKAGTDTATLVRVEAGISIRKLNEYLDRNGLALVNMGGYDAQTIAGATSTSTHGSGIALGPLSDMVVSIDLVGEGGVCYRIEPTNGVTDGNSYATKYPDRILRQDDQWFNAAVVSMGCFGIIHAMTIRVTGKYWLKEVRRLSTWRQVKGDLNAGAVLKDNRHYEFYLNPYVVDGENRCLVTTRNLTQPPHGKAKDKRRRNVLTELAASLPITHRILNFFFDLKPKITPKMIDTSLSALVDDEYTNLSYKVFNIGSANDIPAYSAEIAIPVDERGLHISAVDEVIRVAEERRRVGKSYHTSPVAMRFVGSSDAYLSMMHGRDTMMMELIQMKDTEGGFELIAAHERALYKLGGRPHWGQVNFLNQELIAAMYPQYPTWHRVFKTLSKKGTFTSPFTARVGISRHSYSP